LEGCEAKTVYIKSPKPRLPVFYRDKNLSIFKKEINLKLEREGKESVLIKIEELKELSVWIKKMKKRGLQDDIILKLYEEMIEEFNR
jgi:hypothetical protein